MHCKRNWRFFPTDHKIFSTGDTLKISGDLAPRTPGSDAPAYGKHETSLVKKFSSGNLRPWLIPQCIFQLHKRGRNRGLPECFEKILKR